ncbi:hypothetical protein HPB49_001733 [Dermacentor silvarum]|uniref:Uncharacterized protein n=1 Tax=Dermacentor silvarum TaxID=543639 RepID=A0ACB8CJ56_DERSI|nr:hypothetical protein HPB49_001733 [Dermacentor silvarum]
MLLAGIWFSYQDLQTQGIGSLSNWLRNIKFHVLMVFVPAATVYATQGINHFIFRRSDAAKEKLTDRCQHKGDSYTSHIEEDMTYADRIRHIFKGMSPIAFNTLVVQNPTSVTDTATTCQRPDKLHFLRVPRLYDSVNLPGKADLADLWDLIGTTICEELRSQDATFSSVASHQYAPSGLKSSGKK